MPKGYATTGERLHGARSPAQKANIARIKAQGRAVAETRLGPTDSWWVCRSDESWTVAWADKAKAAAIRMGAVARGPNYRTKEQE